ncbi:MAG: hypothetical protein NZ602_05215 [Thermoguttaceae bacterium]|nr:hypothetical protein [Thermoguttaceae bacterium]MDW8038316.1 hypothetical protein [Thermoguttaceae bacterium]
MTKVPMLKTAWLYGFAATPLLPEGAGEAEGGQLASLLALGADDQLRSSASASA